MDNSGLPRRARHPRRRRTRRAWWPLALGLAISLACLIGGYALATRVLHVGPRPPVTVREHESVTARKLARAAMAQAGVTTGYDASYVPLSYPGGDVPASTGVCADVVVRAFRSVGVDLQEKLHEDMKSHFMAYPQLWDSPGPDPSIDQRRVPNIATYFERRGKSVAVTHMGADYWPGDVVTWEINGKPHTGVVSTTPADNGAQFMIAHNIGSGVHVEDVLFSWTITGHYRYF